MPMAHCIWRLGLQRALVLVTLISTPMVATQHILSLQSPSYGVRLQPLATLCYGCGSIPPPSILSGAN